MAVDDDDAAGGIPEWIVTFGDMMSLLLTFFIMLVSLSEIKKEEQFQTLAEAMCKQFGHDASRVGTLPGNASPRNSILTKAATMGRAKRFDIMRGYDNTRAPTGDHPRVRIIRPGKHSGVGAVITFDKSSLGLTDEMRRDLHIIASEVKGKPQKIESRGHASRRPVDTNVIFEKNYVMAFDMAYQRCQVRMDFLITLGIERRRPDLTNHSTSEPRPKA